MGGLSGQIGFTPFFILRSSVTSYLSSSGKTWDIASGAPIGLSLLPKETYRLKCSWNGNEYVWSSWRGKWSPLKTLQSKSPIAGRLQLQLGTNYGTSLPFPGTINLEKCYISIGGKLWWEGVRGAYKNANK